MTIYKLKNHNKSTWAFTYYENNIRKRKSGYSTQKEAKAAEHNYQERLLLTGVAPKKSTRCKQMLPYQELYDSFMATKSEDLELNSWYTLKSEIDLHITPFFQDMDMWYITSDDVRKWHNYLSTKKYQRGYNNGKNVTHKGVGRLLSVGFKNEVHSNLVQMLNHAISYFNAERNVASVTGRFKLKVAEQITNRKEKQFYTYEEWALYETGLQKLDLMWQAFANLLFFLGPRRAEAKGLKWTDVDFIKGTVHIQRNLVRARSQELSNRIGKTQFEKSTKNVSSDRVLPLPQKVSNILIELYSREKEILDFSDDWYIFGGPTPLTDTTIARKLKQAAKYAGMEKVLSPHEFRHSFATLAKQYEFGMFASSKMLGHSSIDTTQSYTHVTDKEIRCAVDYINGLESKEKASKLS